jgi:GLTT repeat (6 copies)
VSYSGLDLDSCSESSPLGFVPFGFVVLGVVEPGVVEPGAVEPGLEPLPPEGAPPPAQLARLPMLRTTRQQTAKKLFVKT